MKVEHRSGSDERQILTGMIVDPVVVGKIAAKWTRDGLFASKWANLIGMWCCKYFLKYGQAPGARIESIFGSWASSGERSKEQVQLVDKFLSGLSDEHERLAQELNPDWVVDLAGKHFQAVALNKLAEDVKGDLELNDPERAAGRVAGFGRIELGNGSLIDVLRDEAAISAVFEEAAEPPLIEWPGAVGEFFGRAMERDAFVVFLGPEKRGKCIAGDMEILLEDGSISTIEDLVCSEDPRRIMSLNEQTQRIEPVCVSEFWDNGTKPCWEVETRTGRKVVTTENHKYLTPDGWKLLSDLKGGDFIAVPKKLDVFGDRRMDEDELKFLAYMLAEGCCTQSYYKKNGVRKKNGVNCSFTNTDDELIRDFLGCCDRLGFKWKQYGISYDIKGAGLLMDKLGIAGHSAKTKKIPDEVFLCPRDQIALFLRIFMSCDGYVLKSGEVGIGLANERMIRQISHLLVRFGVVHSVEAGDCFSKEGKQFFFWTISIQDSENASRFVQEINMMTYKRREVADPIPGRSFLDKFPYKVVSRFMEELELEFAGRTVPKSLGDGRGKHVRKNHALRQQFGTRQAEFVREQIAKRCPIMRKSFLRMRGSSTYDRYMNSHILWDEVVSIKNVGERRTYDLTVPPHHNFVANDCVVHNTFWLIEAGWQAMRQKKKVLFLEVGDMSQRQIMRRFMVRASRRPFRAGKVLKPTAISRDDDGNIKVDREETDFDQDLSRQEAWRACEKVIRGKSDMYLRLGTWPVGSLSVDGIRSLVQNEQRDGWSPDLIVMDYADLLDMGDWKEKRHAIDRTWGRLRGLSQELHCCVLTATQADSASYAKMVLTMENFSDAKTKNAHATGIVGLNQTKDEKEQGAIRLNWVALRENDSGFTEFKCVAVAECRPLARVCTVSCW